MSGIAGVAASPRSWGASAFWQDEETPGYVQVLDEIVAAGYMGTTLGNFGFLPIDPDLLRDELEQRELSLVSGAVSVALTEPDGRFTGEEEALRVAQLLVDVGGETAMVVLSDENLRDPIRTAYAGRISPQQGFSQMQWEVVAHTLNQIALTVLNETGLRTVFRPHCGGYIETPEEVSFLMEATHPRILGLCLDAAQYAFGGGDPLQLLRRYRDRVWHAYLKGYDSDVGGAARSREWSYHEAVQQGVFCDLAQSSIDLAEMVEELDVAEYAGWVVVEQDVMAGEDTPLEGLKRSREYLYEFGL